MAILPIISTGIEYIASDPPVALFLCSLYAWVIAPMSPQADRSTSPKFHSTPHLKAGKLQ
jgi:hypothetical protein